MSNKIKKGTLVIVYWWDTIGEENWTEIKDIEKEKVPLVKTVGWFLSEDENCIRLLTSICDEDASYSIIPKGTVKDIESVQDDEIEVQEKEDIK